jgi:hypothetical protein
MVTPPEYQPLLDDLGIILVVLLANQGEQTAARPYSEIPRAAIVPFAIKNKKN